MDQPVGLWSILLCEGDTAGDAGRPVVFDATLSCGRVALISVDEHLDGRSLLELFIGGNFLRYGSCAGFLFAPRDRPTRRARECGSGEQTRL